MFNNNKTIKIRNRNRILARKAVAEWEENKWHDKKDWESFLREVYNSWMVNEGKKHAHNCRYGPDGYWCSICNPHLGYMWMQKKKNNEILIDESWDDWDDSQ
jgi:hypothetical protein